MIKPDLKTILEAAVKSEEQSYALYSLAQERVDSSSSKKFLAELAKEELKHKAKLVAILEDRGKVSELGADARLEDLRIVDVMRDATLSDDADYGSILVFAAKREKTTYDYYNSLARGLEGTDVGGLFKRLAQEELSHKSRLEREYDEYVLKEN